VPVARALDYAHQRGVLHRDVKPANILITESGDPMLTDFGIARILDVDGNTLTGVGMSVGTPEYMAPEQWLSKPEPASDQYSLGVILYELLTGCKPFSADTPAAVMIKHITEPLPPPRQYAAGLSGDAERVLYTALAKESINRFASMSAFIQALEELSVVKPGQETAGAVPDMVNVPAVPEPADPGSDHPLINEPTWDGSIPMVHDVETHSDLGTPLQGESSVSDPVESGVLEPLNGNNADQKVKSRSRWIWIGGGLALLIVLFAWLAGPGRRDQIITPPIESIAAVGQINTPTAASAKTETFTPEPTLTFTATPTPTLTATPTPIPVIGPEHIPHFTIELVDTDFISNVLFFPDGKTLASGSRNYGYIKLWRIADGSLIDTLVGYQDGVYSVAISPDGQTLASAGEGGFISLWQTGDGMLSNTLKGHTHYIYSVSFSPDGLTLASGSGDGTIKLWRVSDGSLIRTLEGHTWRVNSVTFSLDGETLASGSARTIKLWRVSDGSLIDTLDTKHVWSIAFSPDGLTLASASDEETIRLWRVADGSLIGTLEGHAGSVESVAFSPDGQTLASGSHDGTIILWRAADGSLITTLKGHTNGVHSVAFSPDGRILASGSWDKTIRIWGFDPPPE
jgi:serine/threonine protein kinase